ncbi:ribosome silencing factor [Brevibacterium otitidis]|uniref:Ribosomal silencing factor RsfS n=1 Tax=Brevibacterium otitidis TaxID=53364 RepID=A0ABV5WZN4_9MICO|nr:ribosome silencing factor [Brevibacterium otitidis]
MTATDHAITLARTAGQAAADKLGTDIVALDVSEQLYLTDIFLIASVSNERQAGAVIDAVEEALRRTHSVKPTRREGKGSSGWSLIDFGDLVVHVFTAEDRQFYALERLWKDCPVVELHIDEAGEQH